MCLPDTEDLVMDLTKKTGVVAGWGVTEATYADTLCGYKGSRQINDYFNIGAFKYTETLINGKNIF